MTNAELQKTCDELNGFKEFIKRTKLSVPLNLVVENKNTYGTNMFCCIDFSPMLRIIYKEIYDYYCTNLMFLNKDVESEEFCKLINDKFDNTIKTKPPNLYNSETFEFIHLATNEVYIFNHIKDFIHDIKIIFRNYFMERFKSDQNILFDTLDKIRKNIE